MKILVADIGNTCTKIAFWTGSRLSSVKRFQTKSFDPKILKTNLPIAVSCVVPQMQKKIKEKKILWINPYLNCGVDFSLINKKQIGADRVAAAAAATANFAHENLIIVHAGTALVVDAINSKTTFLGGAIMPGIKMMSNALHQQTAKLPLINITTITKITGIGRNTRDAIISGVANGFYAAAKHLIQSIAENCEFRKYKVILCGGDAKLLLEQIPDAIYIKNLVLLGTAFIGEKTYES